MVRGRVNLGKGQEFAGAQNQNSADNSAIKAAEVPHIASKQVRGPPTDRSDKNRAVLLRQGDSSWEIREIAACGAGHKFHRRGEPKQPFALCRGFQVSERLIHRVGRRDQACVGTPPQAQQTGIVAPRCRKQHVGVKEDPAACSRHFAGGLCAMASGSSPIARTASHALR